jgi:Na+-transporting methylmalonyl-CoA/oxaloacetate decarboxylase gamma subunit
MNNIEQGLTIMVMGLGLTFSVLGIFIGVIVALQRLFPVPGESDAPKKEAAGRQAVSPLARETSADEIAVAITVALAHLYSYELCRSNLGRGLEAGHGPWWTASRLEQYGLETVERRGGN